MHDVRSPWDPALRRRTRAFLTVLVLCLLLGVPAGAELQADLDAIVARPEFAAAWIGIAVLDPATGRWVYESNARKAFLSASTMKTLSCSYALAKLGADRTLRTTLRAVEPLGPDGTLAGPVYLVGGGDPFTTRAQYRELADRLADAGVRRIAGGLRADDSRLAGPRWAWGWAIDDLPYGYGAMSNAINIDRQRVTFTVRPTREREPAEVSTGLPPDALAVTSEVRTGARGAETSVSLVKPPLEDRYLLRGTIAEDAKDYTDECAIEKPGAVALAVLREQLAARGVVCEGTDGYEVAPAEARELAAIESAPVRELVRRTLKVSDNLGADLLLWNAAIESGAGNTRDDAIEGLRAWLEAEGLPLEGTRLADGSGLSRYSLLTPRLLVRLLEHSATAPYAEDFRQGLPVGGVDGTLGGRFAEGPLKGKVVAKTGGMSRVSTLAGYLTTHDDRTLIFALMWNMYDCPIEQVRQGQADVLRTLYDE